MAMMQTKYSAASLAEIADHFQQKSADLAERADAMRKKGQREILTAEAETWMAAADILRNTTLK